MYKARVSQVDGINVRAGGKWLRCIGNRAVHVGDLIFTDGKYVYGYDKESQTPIIAETPKVDELIIPIYAYSDIAVTFRRSKFKYSKLEHVIKNYDTIINNSKGQVYMFQRSQDLFCANCDDKGTIFSICADSNTKIISIKKNSDTLFSSNFSENVQQAADNAILIATNISNEKRDSWWTYNSGLIWGRIDNEKNWAFIYLAEGGASSSYFRNPDTRDVLASAGTAYYCDSNGKIAELYKFENAVSFRYGSFYVDRELELSNYTINKLPNITFPCQDGFTFKIDDFVALPQNIYGVPQYAKITIYTPDNQKLCSFKTTAIPEITILKISGYQYLIGITPQFPNGWVSDIAYIGVPYDNDCIGVVSPNLYLCKGGSIKNIEQSTNNQHLCFMKKRQLWYKNIIYL